MPMFGIFPGVYGTYLAALYALLCRVAMMLGMIPGWVWSD